MVLLLIFGVTVTITVLRLGLVQAVLELATASTWYVVLLPSIAVVNVTPDESSVPPEYQL